MESKRTFTIYATLKEYAHEGWVCLCETSLKSREIVKISNPATRKSIYCEALQIDANFEAEYRESPRTVPLDKNTALIIGGWYRDKLGGLSTQSDVLLEFHPCKGVLGKFRASIDHPQVAIRLGTWLGAIGLALGVIGCVVSLASL